MTKKALIHIGTGKTGTTSVQDSLSKQKNKLADICYPNITGNAQHFLALMYQEHARLSRGHRGECTDENHRLAKAKTLRNKFIKAIKNQNKLIISSEFLSRFNDAENRSLKQDLDASGFTDYSILCYVRDPVSYFKSVLQQELKASHKPPNPKKFKYKFRDTIESHIKVYGDNITVRAYDDSLHQGDIVQDFLLHASNFFGSGPYEITTKNSNRSLSAEALFILQKYRELYDADKDNVNTPGSQALLEQLKSIPASETSRIELQPGLDKIIRKRYEPEFDWLNQRFGIDFSSESSHLGDRDSSKDMDYSRLENIICKPDETSLDRIRLTFPVHSIQ